MQPTKRSRFGEANLILLFLFFYFSQTCIIFIFNEILEMKPFVSDNETKIRSLLLRLMLLCCSFIIVSTIECRLQVG